MTRRHALVLLLACLLLFGNYYCYDIPGALNVQLREWLAHPYDEWQWEMNVLYAAYSFPNLLMPIVGGVLVDVVGPNKMLVVFVVVVCAGQTLFCLGLQARTYWLMAVGRILFGLGGESLEVAQARITTDWFRHGALGLALGLNLTCARLATAMNDILSPWIAQRSVGGVLYACWIGLGICAVSGLFGVALCLVDGKSARANKATTNSLSTTTSSSCLSDSSAALLFTAGTESRSVSRTGARWSQPSSIEDDDGDGDIDGDSEETCTIAAAAAAGEADPLLALQGSDASSGDERIRWRDILRLPASFWVLCLATVALYGAVNPFVHVLSDLLQVKWGYTSQQAGVLMALPDLISAVGSPVGGFILDVLSRRCGKRQNNQQLVRAMFLPLSGLLLVVVHSLMGFTEINPALALSVLGISYSVFGAALWPLIPQLVHNSALLGTAYGVSTVALNMGLTVVPVIVAKIMSVGSYYWVQAWFVGVSMAGTALSIAVGWMEWRRSQRTQRDCQDGMPSSGDSNR